METIEEILTELVEEARDLDFYENVSEYLIKKATAQVNQQQQCRICDGAAMVCNACHLVALENVEKQQQERVEKLVMLLEAMTELHAEDCKEDECVNILAVRKYLAELEAEDD